LKITNSFEEKEERDKEIIEKSKLITKLSPENHLSKEESKINWQKFKGHPQTRKLTLSE